MTVSKDELDKMISLAKNASCVLNNEFQMIEKFLNEIYDELDCNDTVTINCNRSK